MEVTTPHKIINLGSGIGLSLNDLLNEIGLVPSYCPCAVYLVPSL